MSSHAPTISIPRLRDEFDGRVLAPGDPGYDQARTPFHGGVDRHPAVIVRPADATEVARVVRLARDSGLELAVRSGGHSPAFHSVNDGGIVLDLGAMKALDIDPDARTAWAQTGLTAGEYTSATHAHGLATGFGDTASVGIGGLTLGGGVGYLVRKYGLTIDDLLAAELVTADGQVLHVDDRSHPDLFWAIRGGGGNFGVATRFRFRLHQLDQVLGGMLFLPATPEVIAGFIATADAAPEELSGIANVMPAPPMPMVPPELHGQLVIMAMLVWAGPVEDGQAAVAPFRALATPLADLVQPMPYPGIYPPEEEGFHPTAIGHTMFVDAIDRHAAETILQHLRASDAPVRVAQLRVLGGAMARVPADATAFAHRGSKIMVNVASFYQGPDDQPVRQAWVDEFAAALQQGDYGAYVGSSAARAQGGSTRRTRRRPGSGWPRSRPATTPPTCSGATTTSHPPPERPFAGGERSPRAHAGPAAGDRPGGARPADRSDRGVSPRCICPSGSLGAFRVPRRHRAVIKGAGEVIGARWSTTPAGPPHPGHGPPIEAGEFLLGYLDQTGRPPPMPQPEALGRNSTYAAFRKLHQDVAGSRAFIQASGDSPQERELVAAKMVGR